MILTKIYLLKFMLNQELSKMLSQVIFYVILFDCFSLIRWVVDVNHEGINIQINAPPVEGSANTELVKYIASFLGLKSSAVSLERVNKIPYEWMRDLCDICF